jgi:hypothetical protein
MNCEELDHVKVRDYDIVVIGGGHAGAEAAWAAARLGASVALVSMDPTKIGQMSCNPAIGGLAKGQMVREVDALGGLMGLAIDNAGIQFRMLNRSKGPAVWGPRAQADKYKYAAEVQRLLGMARNLDVIAGEVAEIETEGTEARRREGTEERIVRAVTLADGTRLTCRVAIVTTGTFLRGLMHTGETKSEGGRVGEAAAKGLSGCLARMGLELGRLKTGTPPRLRRGTIDFSSFELQPGDEEPTPFSYLNEYEVGSASADGTLSSQTEIPSAKADPTRTTQSSVLSPQSSPSPWPLAALSGPNIAAELARYLPATAVAAAEDDAVAQRVQAAFSTDWFRVYTNRDAIGVELAGATKNVIAIAAGILDGLSAGNNAKAALVTRGLVEITRLGMAMGAHESTFQGLAGLGDLITTCVSPEGRNRTVGEQIGKGRKLQDILAKMDSVAEGVPTTKAVVQLARRHQVEMPITQAVHEVLFDGKDVIRALTDLMTRDPKPERSGI